MTEVQVRRAAADDDKAIRELVTRTMRSQEAQLVDFVRSSAEYRPELTLVAATAEALAGFIMLSEAWLVGRSGSAPILVLAPLAVAPEHQRRRVGSRLVTEAIQAADQAGYGLVAVLGDARYYSRFGFEPATDYGIQPNDPRVPVEHLSVRRLSRYSIDLRGRLSYPPAFEVTFRQGDAL
jgi:putative acetyltransferase